MLGRPGVKKIVNISPNGAYNFEVFDPAHYRASKAALDTLTKHLARAYAREGIAVNSLAPAMTRTELFDVVPPDVLERALSEMPRGEPLRPAEVAARVGFLVSPAGDCCSGKRHRAQPGPRRALTARTALEAGHSRKAGAFARTGHWAGSCP